MGKPRQSGVQGFVLETTQLSRQARMCLLSFRMGISPLNSYLLTTVVLIAEQNTGVTIL
jgi:hypothetical protein